MTCAKRVQKALSSSERQSEGVREAFRDLEERANRVAGVGTRLGDRLQVRPRARYPLHPPARRTCMTHVLRGLVSSCKGGVEVDTACRNVCHLADMTTLTTHARERAAGPGTCCPSCSAVPARCRSTLTACGVISWPQRADTLRARALELVTLLSHLQLFAHLPDGDSAFSGGQLPPLFREDSKLAEAAVRA